MASAVQKVEDADLRTRPIGLRVLLLDDHESIYPALSAVLPVAGYAVYQAPKGKEPLRSALSVRPD